MSDDSQPPKPPDIQRVTVVDVDVSFTQLVALIFKGALASIPAAIMLTLIVLLAGGIIGACGAAFP